jgi:hypothetical protein
MRIDQEKVAPWGCMQRHYPARVLSTPNTHEFNTYAYDLTRPRAISAGAQREFQRIIFVYIQSWLLRGDRAAHDGKVSE